MLKLFLYTVVYEAAVVLFTQAVAVGRPLTAAWVSACIVPLNYASVLIVVDSKNRAQAILTAMVACGLTNLIVLNLV